MGSVLGKQKSIATPAQPAERVPRWREGELRESDREAVIAESRKQVEIRRRQINQHWDKRDTIPLPTESGYLNVESDCQLLWQAANAYYPGLITLECFRVTDSKKFLGWDDEGNEMWNEKLSGVAFIHVKNETLLEQMKIEKSKK